MLTAVVSGAAVLADMGTMAGAGICGLSEHWKNDMKRLRISSGVDLLECSHSLVGKILLSTEFKRNYFAFGFRTKAMMMELEMSIVFVRAFTQPGTHIPKAVMGDLKKFKKKTVSRH